MIVSGTRKTGRIAWARWLLWPGVARPWWITPSRGRGTLRHTSPSYQLEFLRLNHWLRYLEFHPWFIVCFEISLVLPIHLFFGEVPPNFLFQFNYCYIYIIGSAQGIKGKTFDKLPRPEILFSLFITYKSCLFRGRDLKNLFMLSHKTNINNVFLLLYIRLIYHLNNK